MKFSRLSGNNSSDAFVRRVESMLTDVPRAQRDDVISDLERHLHDVRFNFGSVAELGHPDDYAGDLREAMGLTARPARRPAGIVVSAAAAVLVAAAVTTVTITYESRPSPVATPAVNGPQAGATHPASLGFFSAGSPCGRKPLVEFANSSSASVYRAAGIAAPKDRTGILVRCH